MNIVSEYELTQTEIGYLMVVTCVLEFVTRVLWGGLTKLGVSIPACGIMWTSIISIYAFLMAFSSTFWGFFLSKVFMYCSIRILIILNSGNVFAGIGLGGFGSQIHVYVVELLGLELQPDFMILQSYSFKYGLK